MSHLYSRALNVGRSFEEMQWNARRRGKDNDRWSPSYYCEESTNATRRMIYTRPAAINVVTVVAEVGREVPNASPVLDTFLAVHNMVGMVRAKNKDLEALGYRCSYLIACAIENCRQPTDGINLTPLECCFRDDAVEVMNRCGGRRCVAKALKGVSDKGEVEEMNLRMDRLLYEMGLSGTMAILVSAGCNRRSRNDAAHDVPLMDACPFFLAVGGCSVLLISSHVVFVGCAQTSRTLRRRKAFHGTALIICDKDSSLTPLYLQPMSSDGCKCFYVPFISVGLHCHKYS